MGDHQQGEKAIAADFRGGVATRSVDALVHELRARTPARVLVGRSGPAYRTATQLELRRDHAAARDAVQAEMDLLGDFGSDLIQKWRLFEVRTEVGDKRTHLLRPDLGRRLDKAAREIILDQCPAGADLQIVLGDGLSAAALAANGPPVMARLAEEAARRVLRLGQPFAIRYCRVGVLNDIGELLNPTVVVLLIGERPGLATAESLSAYLAFRPRPGHTDANRNLISNIHSQGVLPEEAATRIISLADKMVRMQASGVAIKEDLLQSLLGFELGLWIAANR